MPKADTSIEALSSPVWAAILADTIREGAAKLAESWEPLSPVQRTTLDGMRKHADELVAATNGGGS
jgi:hypothetical protein